jgi:hypothetical protein
MPARCFRATVMARMEAVGCQRCLDPDLSSTLAHFLRSYLHLPSLLFLAFPLFVCAALFSSLFARATLTIHSSFPFLSHSHQLFKCPPPPTPPPATTLMVPCTNELTSMKSMSSNPSPALKPGAVGVPAEGPNIEPDCR